MHIRRYLQTQKDDALSHPQLCASQQLCLRQGTSYFKLPSKLENCAHNDLICFYQHITYLLLNSGYGIGCVYSPLDLVIFVTVQRTFVCLSNRCGPFI